MKDFTKVMLALLAGLAAGGVTALLLAPEEGAETRRKLAKKAKKLNRKLREKATEYRDKATDLMDKVAQKKDDITEAAENYI